MVRNFLPESILWQLWHGQGRGCCAKPTALRGLSWRGVQVSIPAEVSPPGSPWPHTSEGIVLGMEQRQCPSPKISGGDGTAFSQTPGHSSKDQILTN